MASKDYSNKTPKRIPETRVVGPSRFVKQISGVEDSVVISSTPYRAPNIIIGTSNPEDNASSGEINKFEISEEDFPQPSDIESVTFQEYKNNEGVTKYKVFVKMRNSSKLKDQVSGVDARIQPPGGLA